MKIVLVALALLAVSPDALADGAAWQRERVPVYDHSTAEWREPMREAVAGINAVMPKRGPRLIYRAMPERPCGEVNGKGIRVCASPTITDVAAVTAIRPHRGVLRRAKILLAADANPAAVDARNAACHELMHAVSGIRDNDGDRADSCVWGTLGHPGDFDERFLRRVYRKHGRR